MAVPYQYLSNFSFKLISGTRQNGIWQATKTMPQYSGGNWEIAQIVMYDAVSNYIYLSNPQLAAMGINPILAVSSTLADSTPPELTGFSFSTPVLDTSAASQSLKISVSGSDNLSGVDFSPTTPSYAFYQLGFTSPSGNQNVDLNPFTAPVFVGGTPLAGTGSLRPPGRSTAKREPGRRLFSV